MKTKSTIILALFFAFSFLAIKGNAQFTISNAALKNDSLYLNNINALFDDENIMGFDIQKGYQDYQVPKGSGISSIYSSSLWIGGIDVGGHLRVAGQTYKQNGTDFWPGPLDTANATEDTTEAKNWNKIWSLRKTEIDSFINWSANHSIYPGYVIPQAIATWPGNGNTAKGESKQLAPFFDNNGNGIYEPNQGDYPIIRGDQALFYICNDSLKSNSIRETGGRALGIEMHVMPYIYHCIDADSALWNTVFVHYDIINRSSNQYNSTYIGVFTDNDIGCGENDFVGCDSTLNSFFGYNGEPIDHNCVAGEVPYGVNPPAQSTTFLNMPMTHYQYYDNDSAITGIPTIPSEYYNYMKSIWKDSTHVTYGGNGHLSSSQKSNYMYPSDPNDTSAGSWSEVSDHNPFGNRRALGSAGPLTLLPHSRISFDIAYVFGRKYGNDTLDYIKSVTVMKTRIKDVEYFFQHDSTPCDEVFTTGINEINPLNPRVSIFPNPANDKINIVYNVGNGTVSYNILNVLGQSVSQGAFGNSSNNQLDVSKLPAGIYFLKLIRNNNVVVGKFVKE